MITSTRHAIAGAACLWISVAAPGAARADRVIDAFTAPLPDQTLPYTSTPAPVLWAGELGEFSQPLEVASQTSLPGVPGGARTVKVREATLSNFVYASLVGGELSYAAGLGPSGGLSLEYGVTADLNLNLSSDGSRSFELTLDGDLDDGAAPRPVQLTITVKSSGRAAVHRTFTLLADGVYRFPFSAFSGAIFSDVDYLKLSFEAAQVSGIDFALIGGIRTTASLP